MLGWFTVSASNKPMVLSTNACIITSCKIKCYQLESRNVILLTFIFSYLSRHLMEFFKKNKRKDETCFLGLNCKFQNYKTGSEQFNCAIQNKKSVK